MTSGSEFVFGYGSLSTERRGAPLAVAVLAGHERVWDVAMDNLAVVPGYKWYVDPMTGERPAVFVTFLNVVPVDLEKISGCVGFLLPVTSASELVALDRRERNYDRVDVTDLVTAEGGGELGRVWTYVGKPSARARYAEAAARGQAVIQSDYIAGVERAFSMRGLGPAFHASTRPPRCRVRPLVRVNDSSRT